MGTGARYPHAAPGDGTLEADERAEKATDHERPVGDQLIRPGEQQILAQAYQAEQDAACHGQHADHQQRQTPHRPSGATRRQRHRFPESS